jgi:NAD(P)-dependent dehydrogenase (short-subunit alcohol dehydrogenase family)
VILKKQGLETGVDVLFNVAGVSSRGTALSSSISTTESIMDINFYAPVALTKAVLPSMIRSTATGSESGRDGKHIVVVSSVQGKIAIPFRSSYSGDLPCLSISLSHYLSIHLSIYYSIYLFVSLLMHIYCIYSQQIRM